MLDDLNELKTFRAILAEGSLSAAARKLGVTLAVVSKRLGPSKVAPVCASFSAVPAHSAPLRKARDY
jgi:hypothetical protein